MDFDFFDPLDLGCNRIGDYMRTRVLSDAQEFDAQMNELTKPSKVGITVERKSSGQPLTPKKVLTPNGIEYNHETSQ